MKPLNAALWPTYRPGVRGAFLRDADLEPHLSRYWLNAKYDDPETFKEQVAGGCEVYAMASTVHEQEIHVVSTDKMTGIQEARFLAQSSRDMVQHPRKKVPAPRKL
jgi:hypothetical protein